MQQTNIDTNKQQNIMQQTNIDTNKQQNIDTNKQHNIDTNKQQNIIQLTVVHNNENINKREVSVFYFYNVLENINPRTN